MRQDDFWVKILLSKYVKLSVTSNAWRGVTVATHLLKMGLTSRIFNGKDTLFWRDKWLGDLPLLNDYWMPQVGWRWSSLRRMLPSKLLSKISNVILRQDDEGKDDICWGLTSSSCFSIHSAYESLLNHPLHDKDDI